MTGEGIFRRVRTAYNLERMWRSRLIGVGDGGAIQFYEDMARAGVGEFVIIDHDIVEEPNIATQQVYLDDIGRPKVECVKERILQINPDALVDIYQLPLDKFDDGDFDFIASFPMVTGEKGAAMHAAGIDPTPKITLLCGFTDDFYAQSRINRLGLQFGIPTLCAQMYREGRAAEITFMYPGVTSACHRCMLSPRYKAYLEEGFRNTVTSDGSPVFATTRLNSLAGQIAMALLHHGTFHPRWGNMLTRIGNRTLVQLRMHPDCPLTVFDRVFANADTERVFFDEALWHPQEPVPSCPDCGGTGDLRTAKGKFADTRVMPAQTRQEASTKTLPLDRR